MNPPQIPKFSLPAGVERFKGVVFENTNAAVRSGAVTQALVTWLHKPYAAWRLVAIVFVLLPIIWWLVRKPRGVPIHADEKGPLANHPFARLHARTRRLID